MAKERVVVALVVVMLLLATSASWAYLIEGSKPTWWDDPGAHGQYWLKMEWRPDWQVTANTEYPGGPEPNEMDISGTGDWPRTWSFDDGDGTVADHEWYWGMTGVTIDADGICVPTQSSQSDFNLQIGNESRDGYKLWYVEYALDRIPIDTNNDPWDPENDTAGRLREFHAFYEDTSGLVEITPLDSDWLTVDPNSSVDGDEYLVWWGQYYIPVQPISEKLEWQWFTDGSAPFLNEFYVERVTTGTLCVVPEPASMTLFGLAVMGMIGCLRRRRRK
jgi:hypothetical protein